MSNYYAKICMNGHIFVESIPLNKNEYCVRCGSKLISSCPDCKSVIKEWHYQNVIVCYTPKLELPMYCRSCGNPFPWTISALESTKLAIQEDEQLSGLDCQRLEESLTDLLNENPKTQVAIIRTKKALSSVGKFTADAIRQFIIDFGCELAKKAILDP